MWHNKWLHPQHQSLILSPKNKCMQCTLHLTCHSCTEDTSVVVIKAQMRQSKLVGGISLSPIIRLTIHYQHPSICNNDRLNYVLPHTKLSENTINNNIRLVEGGILSVTTNSSHSLQTLDRLQELETSSNRSKESMFAYIQQITEKRNKWSPTKKITRGKKIHSILRWDPR